MAVAYFGEFPLATRELAQQVRDRVNQHLGSALPEGAIYHAEGPMDGGGWWIFDVWQSDDAAWRFYNTTLVPAIEAIGGPPFQPRRMVVEWQSNDL